MMLGQQARMRPPSATLLGSVRTAVRALVEHPLVLIVAVAMPLGLFIAASAAAGPQAGPQTHDLVPSQLARSLAIPPLDILGDIHLARTTMSAIWLIPLEVAIRAAFLVWMVATVLGPPPDGVQKTLRRCFTAVAAAFLTSLAGLVLIAGLGLAFISIPNQAIRIMIVAGTPIAYSAIAAAFGALILGLAAGRNLKESLDLIRRPIIWAISSISLFLWLLIAPSLSAAQSSASYTAAFAILLAQTTLLVTWLAAQESIRVGPEKT